MGNYQKGKTMQLKPDGYLFLAVSPLNSLVLEGWYLKCNLFTVYKLLTKKKEAKKKVIIIVIC